MPDVFDHLERRRERRMEDAEPESDRPADVVRDHVSALELPHVEQLPQDRYLGGRRRVHRRILRALRQAEPQQIEEVDRVASLEQRRQDTSS